MIVIVVAVTVTVPVIVCVIVVIFVIVAGAVSRAIRLTSLCPDMLVEFVGFLPSSGVFFSQVLKFSSLLKDQHLL